MKTFREIMKSDDIDSTKPYRLEDLTPEQIEAIHSFLERAARYDCPSMKEHAEEMAQYWVSWLWLGKSEKMLQRVGRGNHAKLAFYLRKRARRWRVLDGGDRHGLWTTPKDSKRNSLHKRSDKGMSEYRKRNDLTAWQAAKAELCRTYQYNRSNDRPDMTEQRIEALFNFRNRERSRGGHTLKNLAETFKTVWITPPENYNDFCDAMAELERIDRTEDTPRTCEVSQIKRSTKPTVYDVATGNPLTAAELARRDDWGRLIVTPEEKEENSQRYIDKCKKERTSEEWTPKWSKSKKERLAHIKESLKLTRQLSKRQAEYIDGLLATSEG